MYNNTSRSFNILSQMKTIKWAIWPRGLWPDSGRMRAGTECSNEGGGESLRRTLRVRGARGRC